MCLSIPMQIVALENESGEFAIVERREGESLRRERGKPDADRPATAGDMDSGFPRLGQGSS
jgi:hypothetical protein